MSESTKTLKALREEGYGLAQKAQERIASPDDFTPEELAEAKTWYDQSVEIAERIEKSRPPVDAAAMKGLHDRYGKIDRPPVGGVAGGDGASTKARTPAIGRAQALAHMEDLAAHHAMKSLGMRLDPDPRDGSEPCKAYAEAREMARERTEQFNRSVEFGDLFAAAPLKATFTTSGATVTAYDRPPGMIMVEQQRLTISDLLPQGTTNLPTIRYLREDTFTNAATAVAEEGLKPEASFDTSEADSPVRKIAVVAKVSDELFADFPTFQGYVDGRLRFMVEQREEALVVNGNGTGANLRGILQTSGIQTQAKATDTNGDAIFKAITNIRSVAFFEPDGIVINPFDYQLLRLAKDANTQYYGGGYFMGPYGNGGVPRAPDIWGLPTVITTAIGAGTALVGSFRLGAMIYRRSGIVVNMTNSNEDDFKYNRIAIRAEERLALVVWRPTAFCTVTGIAA